MAEQATAIIDTILRRVRDTNGTAHSRAFVLSRLDELGTVRHLVRMGAFHGQDDPFYMDRYQPRFWSQAGGTTYTEPAIDEKIDDQTTLPFPDAKVRCFRGTKQPEAVILLARGKGLLLTTDGIQHYGDYSYNNLPARLLMPYIGFPRTTIIGPFWMKLMTPEGESIKAEFDEILELEFDSLLSAHGTFLETDAHAGVRNSESLTRWTADRRRHSERRCHRHLGLRCRDGRRPSPDAGR